MAKCIKIGGSMSCNLAHGLPCINNIYRISNATVQAIRNTRNVSYITVSYIPPVPRGVEQSLVLIVSNQTLIRNTYGRIFTRLHIKLGMTLDTDVSSAMTASIPPQARAIRITILPPASPYHVMLGTILQVNNNARQILVGSPNEPTNQMRFNIMPSTIIWNQRGQQVNFNHLRRGQFVRVDHSINQTFSIPPQANAYRIWIV